MHSITSRWDLHKSSDEGLYLGNCYDRDMFASGLKHLFYLDDLLDILSSYTAYRTLCLSKRIFWSFPMAFLNKN